jgi:Phage integrase, N-terminal SAM-like domain
MTAMSPLRRRMIEDMTIRNLSRSTQQSYIYAVAKFSRHFKRSPDRLGMEEVRAYQLHLVEQKYSWAHINQVACALRFFYGITLGQKEAFERIVSGKEPEKLPPGSQSRRDCPFPRGSCRTAQSRCTGDRLCGRLADRRGGASEARLDRQRTDVAAHRGRQGWQGSLCDAVAAAAGCSAGLLAAGAAECMAVSRPGAGQPCEPRGSSICVPRSKAACPDQQACHDPLTAP